MTENWQDILVAPSASKAAERCAHYLSMLHDLDLANMSLVRMAQHQALREHEDSDTVSENIYFDYALLHYFRCFGETRHALGVRIFHTLPDDEERMEAKRLHAFFKDTFDQKLKRPDDIFSQVKVGVALKEGDEKGVNDIFWLMNKFQICKPDLTRAFSGLVGTVKSQVESLAKEATEELLGEARKLGDEKLYLKAMKAKEFSNMSSSSFNDIDLAKVKNK